jgi:hypothetical protein
MIVAHVDKETNRATDWPPDLMALFFELEAAGADVASRGSTGSAVRPEL